MRAGCHSTSPPWSRKLTTGSALLCSGSRCAAGEKLSVLYDNACALARYCRNPVRSNSSAGAQRLRDCKFFLPESHVRGHTACLDPASNYYLPEVRKGSHSILAGVNSEAQEQVFAWVRWLIYVANPMTPTRHRVFFLLLCIARNAHRQPPLVRRQRGPRPWRIWPGSRRLQVAGPELSSPDPAPAAPAEASVVPVHAGLIQAPSYVKNLRGNTLHRATGCGSPSCGATMPKRYQMLTTRSDAGRHKLCLRNGCFSPGTSF